jgi:hypothetical protein
MVCFQTKNPNLGKFWRSLDWKNVDIFYGNLEYFTDIWYNLQPFGMVCGHLVHTFFRFWHHVPRKIWQPCP